jgi:hypothetical protein
MTRAPRNSRRSARAKTNVARLSLRRQIYAILGRHLHMGRVAIPAQPLEKVKFGRNWAATPVRVRIKRGRRVRCKNHLVSVFLHFDSCNGFCAVQR